ncbi:MAG: hypothetical protein WC955_01900 [Elusimicrobiota bacterium]
MKLIKLLLLFQILFWVNPVSGYDLFEQEEDTSPEIEFSQDEWNNVRSDKEKGIFNPLRVLSSSGTADALSPGDRPSLPQLVQQPGQTGISWTLPYESALSVDGQKDIGMNLKYKQYTSEKGKTERNQGLQPPDMDQALRIRINGKVGEKVDVNVDYNDGTAGAKQDISVVYKGSPGEVVQDAMFGDVTLSIPSELLAVPTKNVFGIKVAGQKYGFKFDVVGSQTKGTPKVKKFQGNKEVAKEWIRDIDYIENKYFQFAFPSQVGKIIRGTERIYRDDLNSDNNTKEIGESFVVEDYDINTSTYTGYFNPLSPGVDYTIDHEKNLIIFRRYLEESWVLAIDYQYTDTDGTVKWLSTSVGTPGRLKILKTTNDMPISNQAELGYRREYRNYYRLKQPKIIRDDGRGNFVFKITMPGQTDEVGQVSDTQVTPKYPADVDIDFDAGVFSFKSLHPFLENAYVATKSQRMPTYTAYIEYTYLLKRINLEPNIVPQSERIIVDGRALSKEDYFIDYDSGYIDFLRDDKILGNSVIEISYEQAPFIGSSGESLAGGRLEWRPNQNFNIGGSALYQGTPSSTQLPDVRSAPRSVMVREVDMNLLNLKVPLLPVQMSFSGELAGSDITPNTYGKALIESMEGIKQVDSVGMVKESWLPAIGPTGVASDMPVSFYGKEKQDGDRKVIDTIGILNNEEEELKNINPDYYNQADNQRLNERRTILTFNYGMVNSTGEVSIVQPVSNTGTDYSTKQSMELWIWGDNSGTEFSIRYGGISEDADGDGELDTEDLNFDGLLNPGEDVGWKYNYKESVSDIGAGNGKIDTEDLDKDRVLDTDNDTGQVFASFIDEDGVVHNKIDWFGWKMLKVDLNITDKTAWAAIKQMRLTLRGGSTENQVYKRIKIAYIALVGNKWRNTAVYGVNGGTLTLTALNNEDNLEYIPLIYDERYKELYRIDQQDTTATGLTTQNNWRREQAMSLVYSLHAGSTGTTRIDFTQPVDISKYKKLSFFMFPRTETANVPEMFIFQVGNDTAYFERRVQLDGLTKEWRLEQLSLYDQNSDGIPDGFDVVVGSPSIKAVQMIRVGVVNTSALTEVNKAVGEVWVNDMYLDEVRAEPGAAWKLRSDMIIPEWVNASMGYKKIEPTFRSLAQTTLDNIAIDQYTLDVGFVKLPSIPMNFSATWDQRRVDNSAQNEFSRQQDQGAVSTKRGSLSTGLIFPKVPALNVNYGKEVREYYGFSTSTFRIENHEDISSRINYEVPFAKFDILPTKYVMLRPIPSRIAGSYQRTKDWADDTLETKSQRELMSQVPEQAWDEFWKRLDMFQQEKDGLFDYIDQRESYDANMSFEFWPGFTLEPRYTKSNETRRVAFSTTTMTEVGINKSQSELLEFNTRLGFFKWFNPTANFKNEISDTLNVNNTAYKSLNRNMTTSLSWTVSQGTLKFFKPLSMMRFNSAVSYDFNDSYEAVPYVTQGRVDILPNTENGVKGINPKTSIENNNITLGGGWTPFGDYKTMHKRLKPLQTLTFNGNYSQSRKMDNVQNIAEESLNWPNYSFSIRGIEDMLFVEKYVQFQDTSFNLAHKETEREKSSFNLEDNYSTNWNIRILERFVPNISASVNEVIENTYDPQKGAFVLKSTRQSYNLSTQVSFRIFKDFQLRPNFGYRSENTYNGKPENKNLSADTQNLSFDIGSSYDITLPQEFKLPFIKQPIPAGNRITINSGIKYARVDSIKTASNNSDTLSFSADTRFETSRYLQVVLGMGASHFWDRQPDKLPENNESRFEANLSGRVTLRF